MKENDELLNYIYQNTQMGIISIENIIDITEDSNFIKTLKKQLHTYESINDKVIKILNNDNSLQKSISTFKKIKTYLMINVQTITDKSTSHLAEMLVVGSTMGVIDTIKNLKKYPDCDNVDLLKELHNFEEKSISVLKDFL